VVSWFREAGEPSAVTLYRTTTLLVGTLPDVTGTTLAPVIVMA
jgi:hypothetical protein